MKVKIIILSFLFTNSVFSQSFFKPLSRPVKQTSRLVGAPEVAVQNSFRPLAGVTASLFGDGSQLAGGVGVSFQHNTFDTPSQAWVTQYSISGLLFLDTKASVIGGVAFGVLNGLIQIGPGYDFNAKKIILLTGFAIKFN